MPQPGKPQRSYARGQGAESLHIPQKMKLAIHLVMTGILALTLVGFVSAESTDPVDGHFSSWEDVPTLIDSISEDAYRDQLEMLHQLTRIKLGYPQTSLCLNEKEHKHYMLLTKQRWQQWWESTGKPVSKLKEQNSVVDRQAFRMAWEFLGTKQQQPEAIIPVWIPKTWVLYVTFTNGDYGAREKETWIMHRQAEVASLHKLRGSFSQRRWGVALAEYKDLSTDRADQVLKALCYIHRYAPETDKKVTDNKLSGLYYPHSTLSLRDGMNRMLWNTEGYYFLKSRPEYGNGDSGRSYYFLRSVFSDKDEWDAAANPTSKTLAQYRMFLSLSKPYFSATADDVVQLFAQHGGYPEKRALLEWAEKQKAATNPNMDWELCAGDFNTGSKVNVLNFNRSAINETLLAIKRLGDRLAASNSVAGEVFDADRSKEAELESYVSKMFGTQKKEKEAAVANYPQPLRDLIIASAHPDDSNLKHLSHAIQTIRESPDPKLFAQLVQEMHEGTLRIRSLLNHIMLSENNLPNLKPWGHKQEAIAVGACIDALPLAQVDARDDLIVTLLRVCGGGKIEIESKSGGQSIEVVLTKNGYSMTLGSASNPLSLSEAQKELRRCYAESRANQ